MILEVIYPKLKELASQISKEISISSDEYWIRNHRIDPFHNLRQEGMTYIAIMYNPDKALTKRWNRIYINKDAIRHESVVEDSHNPVFQNIKTQHIDWADPNLLEKIEQIMKTWTPNS